MKTKKIRIGFGGVTNCRECVYCYGWTRNAERPLRYRCSSLEMIKGKKVFISPQMVNTKIRRDCPTTMTNSARCWACGKEFTSDKNVKLICSPVGTCIACNNKYEKTGHLKANWEKEMRDK